jgi:hypothetical protein
MSSSAFRVPSCIILVKSAIPAAAVVGVVVVKVDACVPVVDGVVGLRSDRRLSFSDFLRFDDLLEPFSTTFLDTFGALTLNPFRIKAKC